VTQHFPNAVHVAGNDVEVVDCCTYLGVQISNDGSSEQEVRRRIAMNRDCFQVLQNNIWRSCIRMETKICLLNAYVFPVLLYGAKTWSLTSELEKKFDACQQWAWEGYCASLTYNVSLMPKCWGEPTTTTRHRSPVLRGRRLRLFGHVARSDRKLDHARALCTVISGLPSHWRRPRWTWTLTVEKDLSALSIGLNAAWRRAQYREQWRRTVEAAMLQ